MATASDASAEDHVPEFENANEGTIQVDSDGRAHLVLRATGKPTPDTGRMSVTAWPDQGELDVRTSTTEAGESHIHVTFTPRRPAVGDTVVFVLEAPAESDGRDAFRQHLQYRFEGTSLYPDTVHDQIRRGTVFVAGVSVWAGVGGPHDVIPANPALEHLPPWEQPGLQAGDRERVLQMLERGEIQVEGHDDRASASAALTTRERAFDDAPTVANADPNGCQTGGGGLPWVMAGALCLLLILRRRTRGGAVIGLALVCFPVVEANASVYVYGFVSMWDERVGKSDAAGSLLPTCDSAWTKCDDLPGPNCCNSNDGPACCYRGVNRATLKLVQDGTVLASEILPESGFFLLEVTGNPLQTYALILEYARYDWPNHMRLTTAPLHDPVWPTQEKLLWTGLIKTTHQFHYKPHLRASRHIEPMSLDTAITAIWNEMTMAFDRFALHGETRHRKKKGITADDSLLTVRYTAQKPDRYNCKAEIASLTADTAREWTVSRFAGEAYHGRVVGCDPNGPNNDEQGYFAFPDVKFWPRGVGHARSEGHALAHAIAELGTLITRWNRVYASRTAIRATRSDYAGGFDAIGCRPTPGNNTNNAASLVNNAWALWDWLDHDTAGTDNNVVDDVSISMRNLMDGLEALANTAGTTGQNRTKAEWFWTPVGAPLCADNEACNPGHVCRNHNHSSYPWQCYSGDMHGSNIRDLAHHLQILFPSAGNFVSTMVSNPCIGLVDDAHPFTGGYRFD